MGKRLTERERYVRSLVEKLIVNFNNRLQAENIALEDLYGKVAAEIGIGDRMLRYYLNRTFYPKTQSIVVNMENYLERVA